MYTALYRQWRPNTFDDVVGQEAIVRTLKNQILSQRIAHAYLFCGSRGTGKTSTAKIFSRAINCSAPVDAGPCGECIICTRLSSGNNMDIIEIDAASNNGVDEIRDLRDKVRFPPSVGSYKVYIIDEVHMLSIGAFNALLKTLEEPPSHVVFILATTEPHKLPATILSRCQRFDFKRISLNVMVSRMRNICEKMDIEVEETGFYTIARWAEGGMRDALSLLDQVVGFCGNRIVDSDILSVLGTADQGFIFSAVDHIIAGEAAPLLVKLGRLMDDGKDLAVFLKDIIHHLRNLLVVKVCGRVEGLLDVEGATVDRLISQADTAGQSRIVRGIEILTALEAELKWSTQPRVLFELAVVKICRPSAEDSVGDLMDRMETLEGRFTQGMVIQNGSVAEPNPVVLKDHATSAPQASTPQSSTPPSSVPSSALKEPEKKEVQKQVPKDVEKGWPDIMKAVKKERLSIYTLLSDVKPYWDKSGSLVLVFPVLQGFYVAAVEKEENRLFLEAMVLQATGRAVRIKCRLGEYQPEAKAKPKPDETDPVQRAIEVFGADVVEVAEED